MVTLFVNKFKLVSDFITIKGLASVTCIANNMRFSCFSVLIKTTSYLVDEKIKKTVPFGTNKYIEDV